VNTFIGIMNFTEPGSGWRTTGSSFGLMMSAYIGFLIVVVIIAVYFERRKRNQKEEERRALLEEQGYYMDLV
jgi:Tfp pilus assembly protein PilW